MRLSRSMQNARAMTLIEVMVVSAIFSLLIMVAFASLQSMRVFTRTNTSQIDLQESARSALEKMVDMLQNTGRFMDASGPGQPKEFPKLFKSNGGFPNGYDNANQHPPKVNPKARPGSNANGGDPTLDSDEIIFKLPRTDALGVPVMNNGAITWQTREHGFFIVPGADGVNQLEYRDAATSAAQAAAGQKVQGTVLCRYVDRIQIQDYRTDPTLTSRQLRLTIYLTRLIPLRGALSVQDAADAQSVLTVALSAVVDMRNTAQLD